MLFIVCYVVILTSCKKEPEVEQRFYPRDSHEVYLKSLQHLGLTNSRLYDKWFAASEDCLDSSVKIKAPFQETFVFNDSEPDAYAYRFDIKRGQKVQLSLFQLEGDTGLVFMDLFRVEVDSTNQLFHLASSDTLKNEIILESNKDQSMILRVQSELLHSALYNLNIIVAPSLEFPVSGKDKKAIGSLFGVPRDAGRRIHEGIDIFARRHTPLISVSDGYVSFAGVKEGSLGGKVIWVKDTLRDIVVYYAHLEDVYVQEDDLLLRGDTIGTVGNSGNAITTYPHLHFGIYGDGAVDPYPYVVKGRSKPSPILAKSQKINEVVRIDNPDGSNRNVYSRGLNRFLSHNQYAKVVGTTSTYYKVLTAQGELTYVFYDHIEDVKRPLSKITIDRSTALLTSPSDIGVSLKTVSTGERIEILAYAEGYYYCRSADGTEGWISRV